MLIFLFIIDFFLLNQDLEPLLKCFLTLKKYFEGIVF